MDLWRARIGLKLGLVGLDCRYRFGLVGLDLVGIGPSAHWDWMVDLGGIDLLGLDRLGWDGSMRRLGLLGLQVGPPTWT
jgi:hypothetical protein